MQYSPRSKIVVCMFPLYVVYSKPHALNDGNICPTVCHTSALSSKKKLKKLLVSKRAVSHSVLLFSMIVSFSLNWFFSTFSKEYFPDPPLLVKSFLFQYQTGWFSLPKKKKIKINGSK